MYQKREALVRCVIVKYLELTFNYNDSYEIYSNLQKKKSKVIFPGLNKTYTLFYNVLPLLGLLSA